MRRHPGDLSGRPVDIALLADAGEVEEARAQGFHLALGLATPGSGRFIDAGFRPLPASETACRTFLPAAWPREPAWIAAGEEPETGVPGLRAFRPSDLDAVTEIHSEEMQGQVLRLDRDRRAWERILGGGAAPSGPPREAASCWVIETRGDIEGYVVLEAAPPTLRWREHGVRPGAEKAAADLFWSALAWARGRGIPRIEGWRMPGALTLGPLYPASERGRKDRIPVLLPLAPQPQPVEFAREEDCRIFELDVLEPGGQ